VTILMKTNQNEKMIIIIVKLEKLIAFTHQKKA